MSLSERFEIRMEPADREWLGKHAAKLERSEGAVLRIALREYRAKVSRRKGEA